MAIDHPPVVRARDIALFLDFDGTLVDFADHPSQIKIPDRLIALLQALAAATDGAVAIVTGRPIADIDAFINPVNVPVAGVHGLMRRNAAGATVEAEVDRSELDRVATRLDAFAHTRHGLFVERKSAAVALHYRKAPSLQADCRAAVSNAVDGVPGFAIQFGKSVVEARIAGHDKGTAIKAFMGEQPFCDRRPVFAGDDVTDEDGFRTVNALSDTAITIKIGDGETLANYRIGAISGLHTWLEEIIGEANSTEDAS